jgi:hypothetical protein
MSVLPPLDNTLGAVEIGGVLATFLFGLATLQTYNFYHQFPSERSVLKWTVRHFRATRIPKTQVHRSRLSGFSSSHI